MSEIFHTETRPTAGFSFLRKFGDIRHSYSSMLRSIRKFENLHIACWLVKDTCWVMDFRIPGIFMIFPTLFLAFYITIKFRKVISELYHNIAVCLWIMANSIWMIGEFFFDDTFRPYAIVFFVAGLMVLLFYYGFVNRKLRNYPDGIE